MSGRRVVAVFKRHLYGFRHHPAGVFDLFMWPFVDTLVWGFVMLFIRRHGSFPIPAGFLLGGALLWTLMFRSNLEMSFAFIDDTSWTRNVINLMVTPMSPAEYVGGSALMSLVKVAIGWCGMTLLAFGAFRFSVFQIGLPLAVFALGLMLFGAALSMVVMGMVMRFGSGADILSWGLTGIITPLSAVWYPVSILPSWAQKAAAWFPPAKIFEAMRTVLSGGAPPWGSLAAALGLDLVYLALAVAFALRMFKTLRRRGFVTRYM
jgi:ABC-2 type transport system permease protein